MPRTNAICRRQRSGLRSQVISLRSWPLEIGSERHSFAMRCSMGKGGGASVLPAFLVLEIGRERCAMRCGIWEGGEGGRASVFPSWSSRSGVSDIACAPGPALRMAFKANSSTGGESSVSCSSLK